MHKFEPRTVDVADLSSKKGHDYIMHMFAYLFARYVKRGEKGGMTAGFETLTQKFASLVSSRSRSSHCVVYKVDVGCLETAVFLGDKETGMIPVWVGSFWLEEEAELDYMKKLKANDENPSYGLLFSDEDGDTTNVTEYLADLFDRMVDLVSDEMVSEEEEKQRSRSDALSKLSTLLSGEEDDDDDDDDLDDEEEEEEQEEEEQETQLPPEEEIETPPPASDGADEAQTQPQTPNETETQQPQAPEDQITADAGGSDTLTGEVIDTVEGGEDVSKRQADAA